MELLIAVLLAAAQERAEPPVVAMVVRAARGARLKSGERERSLEDMDLLRAGDVVSVGKEPVTVVFLEDGHGERLLPGKTLTAQAEGAAPKEAAQRLEAKMSKANLKQLRKFLAGSRAGATVLRRGGGGGMPMAGGSVLSRRPAFAWVAYPGATAYEVRVSRDGKPLWKARATAAELKYPADEADLPADATLTWGVAALLKNGQQADVIKDSEFRVGGRLDQQTLAGLRPLTEGDDPDGWLLAALVYEGEKYFGEALKLYERVAERRPRERQVLQKMADYYELSGRKDKADAVKKRIKELRD